MNVKRRLLIWALRRLVSHDQLKTKGLGFAWSRGGAKFRDG
jgi:hypothetical protein